MSDTFPEGFVPLGEAFALALSNLKDRKELENREAALEGEAKKAFCDPSRIAGFSPSVLDKLTGEASKLVDDHDAIVRELERQVRDALADRVLPAFIRVENGQMEQLVDREGWRQEAFGTPGIESVPHHLTNPGPDTNGQPAYLKIGNFQDWLTAQNLAKPTFSSPKKLSAIDSELHSQMSDLLAKGDATSVTQAATMVAAKAKTQGGTRESVIKRLARGYSKHQKS